jgi:exodeoxyribonuclease VII large subunit
VAACRTPVVSGVGHETDFTIVDFVADLRAPTPSAAAEVITPHIDALREAVARAEGELSTTWDALLAERREALDQFAARMRYASPLTAVGTLRQRVDGLTARLTLRQASRLSLLGERLKARDAALAAADPRAILARGYAIIHTADGDVLRSATGVMPGALLAVQLSDGALNARVIDESSEDVAGGAGESPIPTSRKRARTDDDPEPDDQPHQRSLF